MMNNGKNIAVLYSLNANQYKRLKKVERRTAKYLGRKYPADLILTDYMQPGSYMLIEYAIDQMEKDLDNMDVITLDPFSEQITE